MITPISGRAIAASSAIWPKPRIASSRMHTSVSGSRRHNVSGTPISLLKLASAAIVRATGAQSAARMSLVEVLPIEPVIPTTRAPLRSRTSHAIRPSALNASSGTSVAAAPREIASSRNSEPRPTATNRSPGASRRESTWTPVNWSSRA